MSKTHRVTHYAPDVARDDIDGHLWVSVKQRETIYPVTAAGATQWARAQQEQVTEVLKVRLDDLGDVLREATSVLTYTVANYAEGMSWAESQGEPEPPKPETLADDEPEPEPKRTPEHVCDVRTDGAGGPYIRPRSMCPACKAD